jgi:hypothetical protein
MRSSSNVRFIVSLAFVTTLFVAPIASSAEDGLERARRFAEQGKYEEALREHIDFHDNILRTQPDMYGVRISFALSHWIDLGRKYPKALTAMKEIRDQKTTRLLNAETNREIFHDVASINGYLDEKHSTATLFQQIETKESSFAKSIYDLAEDSLVADGQYALARKYIGTPDEAFQRARAKYNRGMDYVNRQPPERQSSPRGAFENIFADSVVRLLLILQNTGDEARAKTIQADALKIVEHDRIKDALQPAPVPAASDRSKNRLPEKIKSALNEAEFTLLSLNPNPAPESEDKSKETFHNYEVLGKTVVRDRKARAELLTALNNGIEGWDGSTVRCFNPRHGISATQGGKTIDLVICFECHSIRTYAAITGTVHTSGSPQPIFDRALKKEGLPISSQ